jgi:fluoroquinolone resistance protein
MAGLTLVQEEVFSESCGRFAKLPSDVIFAYCAFAGFEISRAGLVAGILGCSFTRINWYSDLLHTQIFSNSTFTDCVFEGCSFRSVDFIDCTFIRCRFDLDSMGGACVFDGCRLIDSTFDNCEFAKAEGPDVTSIFVECRFYGCSQRGTRGDGPCWE